MENKKKHIWCPVLCQDGLIQIAQQKVMVDIDYWPALIRRKVEQKLAWHLQNLQTNHFPA